MVSIRRRRILHSPTGWVDAANTSGNDCKHLLIMLDSTAGQVAAKPDRAHRESHLIDQSLLNQ